MQYPLNIEGEEIFIKPLGNLADFSIHNVIDDTDRLTLDKNGGVISIQGNFSVSVCDNT